MNRRYFVTRVGGLALMPAISGMLGLSLVGCKSTGKKHDSEIIPEGLPLQLEHLSYSKFRAHAMEQDVDELYYALIDKSVISANGELVEEQVETLAQSEGISEYSGFYYTDTELQLYSLAYLLN